MGMKNQLETIAGYSSQLREEEGRSDDLPRDDDVEALLFFLERAFYGARRVELSREYFDHAKLTLEEHQDLIRNALAGESDEGWTETLHDALASEIGNSRDCEMVWSTVEWLAADLSLTTDIVERSLEAIKSGDIAAHHQEIRDEVYNVGPKKTSLYLRDLVAVAELEDGIEDEWAYIVPIDTRIETVASAVLDMEIDSNSWRRSAEDIAEVCREHAVSPVEFDEGAWYVSANALEILLDSIGRLDPPDQ